MVFSTTREFSVSGRSIQNVRILSGGGLHSSMGPVKRGKGLCSFRPESLILTLWSSQGGGGGKGKEKAWSQGSVSFIDAFRLEKKERSPQPKNICDLTTALFAKETGDYLMGSCQAEAPSSRSFGRESRPH